MFPESAPQELDHPSLQTFSAIKRVTVPEFGSTAQARAAGVRAATAPIVVMTEEHSLPEPSWAEALYKAHQQDVAAVGPAVKNGNPTSLLSWANLAIEYHDWIHPVRRSEAKHLPGHNSSYRRDVLASLGGHLDRWLEAESILHWDLRARGHKIVLEPDAITHHHNFSKFFPSLALRFYAGRHFAGMCKARWSPWRCLVYMMGSPAIPFVRLFRIVRQFLRPGRPARRLPALVPVCLFLLSVEAAGAFLGFMLGPGRSASWIATVDFHRERYMCLRDRQACGL